MTCSMQMQPSPPSRSSWVTAGSRAHKRMSWPMTSRSVQIIMLPARSSKGGHIPQGDHMPPHKAITLREKYDQALHYAHDQRLPLGMARPLATAHWHPDNIQLL